MLDDGITLSSSNYAMTYKEKKNHRDMFKIQMKIDCLYLKAEDDTMFKNKF